MEKFMLRILPTSAYGRPVSSTETKVTADVAQI
jgi:hypothetical protein